MASSLLQQSNEAAAAQVSSIARPWEHTHATEHTWAMARNAQQHEYDDNNEDNKRNDQSDDQCPIYNTVSKTKTAQATKTS